MEFKEEMKALLKEMAKKIEMERFLMGMGKVEFAEMLGIHYHTYNSFLKQDRVTHPKTGSILVKFLIDRKANIEGLAQDTNHLVDKFIFNK